MGQAQRKCVAVTCGLTASSQTILLGKKHIRENNRKGMLMPLQNHAQVSIPNCVPHTCLLTVLKARAGASLLLAGGTRLLESG